MSRRACLTIALFALVLLSASVLSQGNVSASQEQTSTELSKVKGQAKSGDASAEFTRGYLYEPGKGVPRDYRQAVEFYRAAAERGQGAAGGQRRSGAGEVPFKLVNGFLIVFEGRIGNLTKLKFVLDTGATHSIVDRKLAWRMGIPLHRKQILDFDKFVEAAWGIFPDVNFGPIQLVDVSMLVGNLAQFSDFATEVDGIIGSDLLSLNSFTIDYDIRKMFFNPPKQPASLLKPHPVGLILELQVQGHPIDVLVDTGTQGIVLFKDRLRSQIPNLQIEDETPGIIMRASRSASCVRSEYPFNRTAKR